MSKTSWIAVVNASSLLAEYVEGTEAIPFELGEKKESLLVKVATKFGEFELLWELRKFWVLEFGPRYLMGVSTPESEGKIAVIVGVSCELVDEIIGSEQLEPDWSLGNPPQLIEWLIISFEEFVAEYERKKYKRPAIAKILRNNLKRVALDRFSINPFKAVALPRKNYSH